MKKKLLLVICLALVMVLALSAVAMAADISSVSITITEPLVGRPIATSFAATNNTTGASLSQKNILWYEKSGSSWTSTSDSTFQNGKQYRVMMVIKPSSGYFAGRPSSGSFAKYTGSYTVNGKSPSTADKNDSVAYGDSGTSYATCLVAYYTFPTLSANTAIYNVSVYAADSVTVGERLGNYYKSSGSNYSFKRIMWRSKTHDVLDSYINTETRAEAGESYRYRLYLKPDSGYIFPGEYEGYSYKSFQGTVKLNGKSVQGFVDTDGALFVESDWMTAGSAPGIDNIALTVDAPVIGAKPATTFKAVNKTNSIAVGPESIIWQEKTDAGYWRYISTEKFVQGVQYQVQMVVKPSSGCFAGAENSTARVNTYTGSLTINGSKPKSGTYDVFATGEDNTSYARCLVVTYDFPALGTLPVITEQPKTIYDAKVGGTAVFTVKATGDDLHYKWYGGTDASPTPLGGDAPELTLTNLTQNNNNTDFWCEVSNSAGTVKSLKATLYVSDYVFPFTDVYANDWFYNDVKNANKLKLIDGKTPTLFKPYDNMTYAEAIKLSACMNQVYNTGTVTLKNGSPWYQSYVDYAKTHGIPWNYPDYNAAITRKDYVYIFYSALPASDYKAINSIGLAKIPDVGPSTFASTEILAFYNAGILTGYTDGSFAPDRNIQRSEVATILSRMMDHNARKSFSL